METVIEAESQTDNDFQDTFTKCQKVLELGISAEGGYF
jgi:hypothetical protein